MVNTHTENRNIAVWVPPIIWAFVIFCLSVLPADRLEVISIGHLDKLAHFVVYLILAILMVRAFRCSGRFSFKKSFSFTLILGVVYGILMELAQVFVVGRNAEMLDIVANVSGLTIGVLLGRVILWQK